MIFFSLGCEIDTTVIYHDPECHKRRQVEESTKIADLKKDAEYFIIQTLMTMTTVVVVVVVLVMMHDGVLSSGRDHPVKSARPSCDKSSCDELRFDEAVKCSGFAQTVHMGGRHWGGQGTHDP